jgi:cupin fold WbuC family metalloprotein
MALQGQGKLIFFDDQGNPNRLIKLDSKEQTMVWIPEGVWHTLVATSEYLIVFENKTGPWKEGEDKVFHEAYPLEGEEGTSEVLKKWEQLEL